MSIDPITVAIIAEKAIPVALAIAELLKRGVDLTDEQKLKAYSNLDVSNELIEQRMKEIEARRGQG